MSGNAVLQKIRTVLDMSNVMTLYRMIHCNSTHRFDHNDSEGGTVLCNFGEYSVVQYAALQCSVV